MEYVELTAKGFELVHDSLVAQTKLNNSLIVLSTIALIGMFRMNQKIRKLSNELEELKQTRGE